ncbi:MAG: ribosome biogenesis GTPase YlqF [Clostridia bacterium]|nr:ribosome biogenesis GTPase YlqF [Clostridia bacterium]
MVIQWFPGHMTKALRMMEEEIKLVDLVIYVLDSRAPFSCVNPSFTAIIGNKPIIYVLNKADLADKKLVMQWAKYFTKENTKSIMLDSTLSGSSKQVVENMKILLKDKLDRNARKGIILPLRAMILGVPNSGKSTLINNLCNKGKMVTGNRPGVTKGKQWVKIFDNIELLDTPGTLWPSFDSEETALHLAYIGSIRDQVLDLEELALNLIKDVLKIENNQLESRYNFSIYGMEPIEIYENICKVRGFVLRGGEYDYGRGAVAILDDFRKAKLGKITLDKPKAN